MLNKKVAKLMVNQVNKELYSSYLYLAIANYYAEEGLNGFASWFKKQALLLGLKNKLRKKANMLINSWNIFMIMMKK